MTVSRRWSPVVALVVLAGLVLAGTSGRTTAGAGTLPRGASLPVESTALVCPSLIGETASPTVLDFAAVSPAGPGSAAAPAAITSTPLSGPRAKATNRSPRPLTRVQATTRAPEALLLEASGPGAAGLVADERRLIPRGGYRGFLSSSCVAPGTDWWFTGADGRVGYTDTLLIANPGSTVANVTVTAWASTGRLVPPKLQAFTVAARQTLRLTVADYTPDAALVSLHVHANSGRITAAVFDRRVNGVNAAGVDWIPATAPPATDIVIPGLPAGEGSRRLVVANPGAADATVALRLATASGNFSPAGHPTLLVRAGHTALVDLSTSLGGAAGAAILHSDVPVTAAAISTATAAGKLPDMQWLAATSGLTGPAALADNTPPFGNTVRIYLTAPGAAARVQITAVTSGQARTLAVAAGRTVTLDPVAAFGKDAYGPLLFTPIGAAPVYASRTLYALGAHGPLTTAEQPTVLPSAATLPPVVEDPRAAVP